VELSGVGDVLLHCSHSTLGGAKIRRGEPNAVEELPSGFVELADVPHDIHVTDMVTLPGVHSTAVTEHAAGDSDA
jgi:hypothetical protein